MKPHPEQLHRITFAMAIIGLLITIAGNFYHSNFKTEWCYLIGALILLVTALLEKNLFFSVLETILSVGAAIAFFHISPTLKTSVPIVLGILAAIYFSLNGELRDYLTWLSVIGVIIVTCGYALVNPAICMSGGAVVTTYSFCAYRRGETIALAFGILNSVFTVTALLEILKIL